MFLFYTFLILFLAELANGKSCPTKYLRFSQQHSFCSEPNQACKIKMRGLYNETRDKHQILKSHNRLRSRIALGKEKQAGGLPEASNMMKLQWDKELAEIAQKWAENCKIAYDCNECRLVENFPVGQNIAVLEYPCADGKCGDAYNGNKPNWTEAVNVFYNEMANFDKKDVEKFGSRLNIENIGQLAQMIWANTWKIGCGFVAYQYNTVMRNVFVCNYGPTGRHQNAPIYIPGIPCSNCPINSCCGKTCKGTVKEDERFGGLCIMLKKREAPVYRTVPINGLLFKCNFTAGVEDCQRTSKDAKQEIKKTLSGNVVYMKLRGGEETKMSFAKVITSDQNYCLRITLRKGSADAGQADHSKLEVVITPKGGLDSVLPINYPSPHLYRSFTFDISNINNIKFKVKFSVPKGEPEHILEVKQIMAHTGSCKKT